MQPNLVDVRQEVYLQDVCDAALAPDDYVYNRALGTVYVRDPSGFFLSVPRGALNRSDAKKRAIGVPAPIKEFPISKKRYSTEDFDIATPLYWKILDRAPDPQLLRNIATIGLAKDINQHFEQQFVDIMLQPGVWSGFAPNGIIQDVDVSDTTKGYSQGCFNLAGSNPQLTIEFAQRVCKGKHGLEPRILVVTEDIFSALKNHPLIKDDIKYTGDGAIPLRSSQKARVLLAELLGVDELLVLSTVVEQSAEGQVANGGYLSKNCMLLLYKTDQPSVLTTSAAYLFQHINDASDAGQGVTGLPANVSEVRSWQEPTVRREIIEASSSAEFNIVSPDLGVFFKNVLSFE